MRQRRGQAEGLRANAERAGRMLSVIGRLTRVVVRTDLKRGDIKFASAHDLRRSSGTRWAPRVKAPTLMRMMRHESIQTTMAFYVDLDADEIAEDLYRSPGEQVPFLVPFPPLRVNLRPMAATQLPIVKRLMKYPRQDSNLRPMD